MNYLLFGVKYGQSVFMNNSNQDLISVIIPCFNSGNTIKRTVESIRNQSWLQKEIIIVNDGSNEKKTLEILKNLDHIKIINQQNNGLSSARNKGAINSSGKFLLFLDADDWLEPNALELMYSQLFINEEKTFVFSDIKLEGESQNIIKKEYNFFEQLFLNQIPYCILISKNNWLKAGGYDENMRSGYEDWEFNIRLGSKGIKGVRIKLPLFHYSVNSSGMLISKSSKQHTKIWKYIQNKHKNLYQIKTLIEVWITWKDKLSTYPLFIFFIWFAFSKILPERFFTSLFIFFRNKKWLIVRGNINQIN